MIKDVVYSGKYLRCKYCDISIQKEFTNAVRLQSEEGCTFDRYGWHCPVCDRENRSYEFTEQREERKTNISDEEYLELLVKLDKYARKVDKHEYGLPITLYFEKRLQPENLDEDEVVMVNIIKEWMVGI